MLTDAVAGVLGWGPGAHGCSSSTSVASLFRVTYGYRSRGDRDSDRSLHGMVRHRARALNPLLQGPPPSRRSRGSRWPSVVRRRRSVADLLIFLSSFFPWWWATAAGVMNIDRKSCGPPELEFTGFRFVRSVLPRRFQILTGMRIGSGWRGGRVAAEMIAVSSGLAISSSTRGTPGTDTISSCRDGDDRVIGSSSGLMRKLERLDEVRWRMNLRSTCEGL